MSATNPSYDPDALHRAQRAYEPSMEEILASIRNIISEERPGMGPLPSVNAAPQAAARPAPAAPPPVVDRQPPPVERVVEPAPMPRVVWPKPEAETKLEPPPLPEPEPALAQAPVAPEPPALPEPAPAPARDQRLMSPEADAAIAHSFDALSVSVAVQNSNVIDEVVRDMIRPMLKAWLDDHLPSMVESLVRAEIQRVARGGR